MNYSMKDYFKEPCYSMFFCLHKCCFVSLCWFTHDTATIECIREWWCLVPRSWSLTLVGPDQSYRGLWTISMTGPVSLNTYTGWDRAGWTFWGLYIYFISAGNSCGCFMPGIQRPEGQHGTTGVMISTSIVLWTLNQNLISEGHGWNHC